MRTFRAKIDEVGGAHLEPEYMASDDFWKHNDPKEYLIGFWGLEKGDVVDYELFEVIDGKEVAL